MPVPSLGNQSQSANLFGSPIVHDSPGISIDDSEHFANKVGEGQWGNTE